MNANPTPARARKELDKMMRAPVGPFRSSSEELEEKGLIRQAELARLLGLRRGTLISRFKGRSMWTPTDLNKFVKQFGGNAAEQKQISAAMHRLAARAQGWNV